MNKIINKLSKEKTILNNRYIIKEQLGSGITSTVYKVEDMQTEEIKAAKIFEKNMKEEFEKEVNIFNKISEINASSNIKYYESGIGSYSKKGRSVQKMYIILEYGNHGSLYDVLFEKKSGFSEVVIKLIFFIILNAIEVIHRHGICHRDIKPENMLFVGDNYDIKLCDFGCSKRFLNKNNKKILLHKRIGTPYYCAPEILEAKKYQGDKIDIFSIGALLFILMTGKFAFKEAKENNNLYKYIKTKKYDTFWDLLENQLRIKTLSEKFKKLFVKLVAYNPEERPSIDEIKNDEWMEDILNSNDEELNFLKNKMIGEIKMVSL